ncbi:type III-D CRISPR-associated protein Csx19 [Thermoleptolyngbya sp.]
MYRQSEQDISLEKALNQVKDLMPGAIALFYSPQACRFGRLEPDGQVTICTNSKQGWQAQTLDLSPVFEARIFNEQAELRWLKVPRQNGRAVLLTELEQLKNCFDSSGELPYLKSIDQAYLLWGKRLEQSAPEGWSILSAARIGAMAVPISSSGSQDTVILHSREYPGEVDEYGNVAVQEERLMELTWLTK